MTGMIVNNVNTLATEIEMVIWDNFAVINKNIPALNPQIFQVLPFKKCDSMIKL